MSPQMKKLIHFTHSFSLPSFFLVLENWAQILAKNGRHVPILSYTLALLFFFNLRQDSLKHEVLLSQCLRLPLFPSPLSGVKLLWATRPSSIIYYNCMRNFFFFNFWDYNITTSFPPSPSSPQTFLHIFLTLRSFRLMASFLNCSVHGYMLIYS